MKKDCLNVSRKPHKAITNRAIAEPIRNKRKSYYYERRCELTNWDRNDHAERDQDSETEAQKGKREHPRNYQRDADNEKNRVARALPLYPPMSSGNNF